MNPDYCFMKTLARLGCVAALVATSLSMGCATRSTTRNGDDQASGVKVPPALSPSADRSGLPPTSDEAMYRVFSAEVLGSEGELEKSAGEYLAAAMESDDPEIAQRATTVAIAAQAWQYAAMASDRWALLEPHNLDAQETAARSKLIVGDYAGAEQQMSEILDFMSHDEARAWRVIAMLLVTAQSRDKGKRVLERLIDEHDAADNAFALFAQSQFVAQGGDLPAAMVLAESAVERAPEEPELHAWAGRLAVNLGDEPGAIDHYRQAFALQPQNVNHTIAFAELLKRTGLTSEANEILAGLADTPKIRLTRIAFALDSNDMELAESLYSGYATTDYEATEGAFYAAQSAELLSRPEEAIAWYEQIQQGDRLWVSILRRAFLLTALDRLQEARDLLAAARVDLDESFQVETYVVESQILLEAGQPDAAYGVLDEALAGHQGDIQLRYSKALMAVELDRIDVAEQDLRLILEQDPGNAAALNALGYTFADRLIRLDEAEALIKEAYALEPGEASIIDSMGWIAYRMGRMEEAEYYLREAFEKDRNAEIAAHLGEVLWVGGNPEDARDIWSMGFRFDPENRVLRETMNRFGFEP